MYEVSIGSIMFWMLYPLITFMWVGCVISTFSKFEPPVFIVSVVLAPMVIFGWLAHFELVKLVP